MPILFKKIYQESLHKSVRFACFLYIILEKCGILHKTRWKNVINHTKVVGEMCIFAKDIEI